jgi:hypothetical protein
VFYYLDDALSMSCYLYHETLLSCIVQPLSSTSDLFRANFFHLDIASHLELLWSLAMKSMNEEHTEANKPCIDHACSCRWWHHDSIMLMR